MAYESEIEKLQRRYDEKPEQWFAALADAHRKAGEIEEALRIVREGIEVRPNYVSGHIVHGRCLVDQGDDSEAQVVFEEVLSFDAENIIALRMLGEIGERTGNVEDAQRWLGRLLEVDPMNDEGRELLERIESGGVGVGEGEEAPVDFGGSPELPLEASAPEDEAGQPAPDDMAKPTVEMPPVSSALEEDHSLAEPDRPTEPDTVSASADILDAAPPQPEAVFDPAEPEPEDAPAGADQDPGGASEPEPFVIRQEPPFGGEDDGAEDRASFDAVLPENKGGVFGVTEIDFESEEWQRGSSAHSEIDLPVGDQEVSLDDLPTPTGDSGLPVGDQTVSLDDIRPGGGGDSDLPAGDREIALDDITPVEPTIGTGSPVEAPEVPDPDATEVVEPLAPEVAEETTQPVEVPVVEPPSVSGLEPPDLGVESTLETDRVTAEQIGSDDPLEEPVSTEADRAAPEPDAGAAPAPEPAAPPEMVTETLAEVYVKQGLVSEAKNVYRQLIEANPTDVGLRERLEALDEPEPVAPAPAPPVSGGTGSGGGGMSARAFLSQILAARPGADPVVESPPASVATVPAEPTPLEQAFGEGTEPDRAGDEDDDSPLAAVFDREDPEAVDSPPEVEPEAEAGMSFDRFFRTDADTQAGADEEEKSEDDEDFKNWLQGLKS